jgi:hypothetical protein
MAKETPEKETPSAGKTYYVGRQAIFENGNRYEPGAEIKLSQKRAKALGSLVSDKPAEK